MSADYSFYALLCGFMPRPEGVQKRRTRVLLFFLCLLGENPGYASLPGRLGGCKLSSTRLPTASSAVEPLRGYRSEKRKFLAFLLLLNELSNPPWGAPVAHRGHQLSLDFGSVSAQSRFPVV